MAFFGLGITAVEKAFVAEPRTAAVLYPRQTVIERLFGRDIEHIQVVPVRAAFRNAVNNVLALVRPGKCPETRSAVGGGRVGREHHPGRSGTACLPVVSTLVLQPVV